MEALISQLPEVLTENCLWLKGAASRNNIPLLWVACIQWLVHKEVQTLASLPRCMTKSEEPFQLQSPPCNQLRSLLVMCHRATSPCAHFGFPHTHRCFSQEHSPTQHLHSNFHPRIYISGNPTLVNKPLLFALSVQVYIWSIFQLTLVPIMCWAQS